MISAMDFISRPAALQSGIIIGKALQEALHHLLTAHRVVQQLEERYGVGRITAKDALVHVDARPDDGAADDAATQVVLQQHAANLAVAHVDVVGPLDADAFHIGIERLSNGQRRNLRKQKLAVGFQEHGAQRNAEKQVVGRIGLPARTALPAPCRLKVGCHQYKRGRMLQHVRPPQIKHG